METFVYGVDNSFWLKLFLLLFILGLVIFLFNTLIRKLLNVKKRKTFSHYHLNNLHKKIDWTIKNTIIIVMIIGFFINISRPPSNTIDYLQPHILLILSIFLTETVTAFMEWKYAENRNAYILTLVQLTFLIILVLVTFMTDFFGFI